MAELALLGVPASILLGGAKYLYEKYAYKRIKKSIYRGLGLALEELNYDNIIKYYDLLKDLDSKQFDKLNNVVKKKLFEKLLCKERVLKQDKLEKLFKIGKDVIENEMSLKQWLNDKRLEKQKSETESIINKELEVIEEQEYKQNEAVDEICKELETLKAKKLHSLALLRKIIDEVNMTEIIEDIHREYESVIKSKVNSDFTFQKNIVLAKRKEQLKKKQDKLARIAEFSSGSI